MGSLDSAPRLPDAWEKISSPFALTATKTKPGILSVEEVASSIAAWDGLVMRKKMGSELGEEGENELFRMLAALASLIV